MLWRSGKKYFFYRGQCSIALSTERYEAEVKGFEMKFEKRAGTGLGFFVLVKLRSNLCDFVSIVEESTRYHSVPTDEKSLWGYARGPSSFFVAEIVRSIGDRKHEPSRPAGN